MNTLHCTSIATTRENLYFLIVKHLIVIMVFWVKKEAIYKHMLIMNCL